MKIYRALLLIVGLVAVSVCVAEESEQEFPKPGPEQELLGQMAGVWQGKMTCNFPGQDAPVESAGVYTAKLDVGGYFLITEFKGDFAGQPFQGRGITGYDPFVKSYTGVWVDSMAPSLYNTRGEFDKAGKVYTETMEGPGPDGKPMKLRSVTKLQDKDRMLYTMFTTGEDGKDTQMMEVKYTRKE